MPGKFRKGDKVTVFGVYSRNDGYRQRREQIFYYQFCIVTSWGKRQGTLVDAGTGEPIHVQVYEKHADHIFPGHNREIGLPWCEAEVAEQVEHLRRVADRNERDKTWHGWAEDVARGREAANEIETGGWRLISLNEAYAETDARLLAEREEKKA